MDWVKLSPLPDLCHKILTGYEKRLDTPLKEGATDPDWIG